MDNEQHRPPRGDPPSSAGPAPRVRLPGYDGQPRGRGPAQDWQGYDDEPPRAYPGYPRNTGYPRDSGVRRSRQASTWTAAALIAGVAATTGYLAYSIPAHGAGSGTSGGTTRPATKPGTVRPSAPAVNPPVVTSGGSGAAAHDDGGNGGDD